MEMYEGKILFAEFDNQWNAAEDGPTKHSEEYSQDTHGTNDSLNGDKIKKIYIYIYELLYIMVEERHNFFKSQIKEIRQKKDHIKCSSFKKKIIRGHDLLSHSRIFHITLTEIPGSS